MTKCFMNGELFVKTSSKKTKQVKFLSPKESIGIGVGDKIIKAEDISTLPPLVQKEVYSMLERDGIVSINEVEDYSPIGIYQIIIDGERLSLLNKQDNTMEKGVSQDRLEKEYIKLEEMINKAVFIGRKFVSKNQERSYDLLYKYESIYILRDLSSGKYIIASSHSKLLEDYEIGDMLKEYYTKDELYKDILRQEFHIRNNGPSLK